mgnify:CR=1 FL=1
MLSRIEEVGMYEKFLDRLASLLRHQILEKPSWKLTKSEAIKIDNLKQLLEEVLILRAKPLFDPSLQDVS